MDGASNHFTDCLSDDNCTLPLRCNRRAGKCILPNPDSPLRDYYAGQWSDPQVRPVVFRNFNEKKLPPQAAQPWIGSARDTGEFFQVDVQGDNKVDVRPYDLSALAPGTYSRTLPVNLNFDLHSADGAKVTKWIEDRAGFSPYNTELTSNLRHYLQRTSVAQPQGPVQSGPTISPLNLPSLEERRRAQIDAKLRQEEEEEEMARSIRPSKRFNRIRRIDERSPPPSPPPPQRFAMTVQESPVPIPIPQKARSPPRSKPFSPPKPSNPPQPYSPVPQFFNPPPQPSNRVLLPVNDRFDDLVNKLVSLPNPDWRSVYTTTLETLRELPNFVYADPEVVENVLAIITQAFTNPSNWLQMSQLIDQFRRLGIEIPDHYLEEWTARLEGTEAFDDLKNIVVALGHENRETADTLLSKYINPHSPMQRAQTFLLSYLAQSLQNSGQFSPSANQLIQTFIVKPLQPKRR